MQNYKEELNSYIKLHYEIVTLILIYYYRL
jgi:hypothetical protein